MSGLTGTLLLFFVTALAISAVQADDIEEDNGVLVLTEDNFDGALKSNEHILVEFYAPWCGHCKALVPEYEKAAQNLKSSGSSIRLAKVDATEEKSLGDKFEIRGFPTLIFFKGDTKIPYTGSRTADGIVEWLLKKTGPPAKEVKTVEEVEELKTESDVVVVGFFKDQESEGAQKFKEVAQDDDDLKYLITSEQKVWDNYKVQKDAVILLTTFDDGRADFDGEITAEAVTTFVKRNSLPLLNTFSPQTAARIFGAEVKTHFLLLASGKSEDIEKQSEVLRKVAKDYKDKLIFVFVDFETETGPQVVNFFGVDEKQLPDYVIFEMEKQTKYLSGGKSVTDEDVRSFVEDFFAGKLEPTLKSEEIPEDWDKEPVKVLVGKNFDEIALDKEKDVFVEFYAPWCGHCKTLEPKWVELAEHFKDREDVVIAKIDGTANEVQGIKIQGFPTLQLFKKGTNDVVKYEGEREVASLIAFLEDGDAAKSTDKKDEL